MNAQELLKTRNRDSIPRRSAEAMERTARDGQHPYAVVACCSDSRVIPEQIFGADVGELFVIRIAGNVLDGHALGSIEYAVSHLGTRLVLVLGHMGCGAVAAALAGHSEGYISLLTDEIRKAIGMETDPDAACRKNVRYGVMRIREAFGDHPAFSDAELLGAVYDIRTGLVDWQ